MKQQAITDKVSMHSQSRSIKCVQLHASCKSVSKEAKVCMKHMKST